MVEGRNKGYAHRRRLTVVTRIANVVTQRRRDAGAVPSQQVKGMVGEGNQAYVDGRVQDAIRVIRIESRAISACAVLANRQALHAHSDGADFPDELEGNTRNIFQPVSQTSRMEESDVRFPFCFSFPFFSTHPSSDTRVCERNSYPPLTVTSSWELHRGLTMLSSKFV